MGQETLVIEQIDAGETFVRSFSEYAPVDAAFWINPADSEDWYLYVASPNVSNDIRAAYGEVLRLVGVNRSQWLDSLQIKLLDAEDPLAVKVIEIRDRYPLKIITHYNGSSIAGTAIDGAIIYPKMEATTSAP